MATIRREYDMLIDCRVSAAGHHSHCFVARVERATAVARADGLVNDRAARGDDFFDDPHDARVVAIDVAIFGQ